MPAEPVCLPLDHGGPVDRPFEPFPCSALDGSVLDRFNSIAGRFGGRLAIQDLTRRLTYSELSALVERIAAATSVAVAGRTGPVVILLKSEARFPAAMLGVLAAGRPYVPLTASEPQARNRLIAEQSGAAAVISAGDLVGPAGALLPSDVPVTDLDLLDASPQQSLRTSPPGPADTCLIVYTSGSTGSPKGAYRSHRSVLHDVMQATNALHLNCEDRVALVFSPSVNAAVRNIYGALLNGAELHILPPLDLLPTGLCNELRSRGVTVLHVVPTLFRRIAGCVSPGDELESVRLVFLSSERSSWADIEEVQRVCPSRCFVYVALASTECTVHLQWFVDASLRSTRAQPPVGRAIPDRKVTLVDEDGIPVAEGEIGELVVASRYIAVGYWNAPELTHQAFAIDPVDPDGRMFRTGDLCRRGPDGLFDYIGRKDQEFKLRGHRVNPAEVESVLMSLPEVAEAAVAVRRNTDNTVRSLAAYVMFRPGVAGLLPRHLVIMLRQRLPPHLVPWPIVVVDDLPRLPGLKINRARLAQIDADRSANGSDGIASEVVADIIRIFERVIGIGGATAEDNIASLGGDSLQAVDIAAELEQRFGVTISDEAMTSAQTIQELASWIELQRGSAVGQRTRVRGDAE